MSRLDGDTIVAPVTGPGTAAVRVLRLSGPDAGPMLGSLGGRLPAPRHAVLRALRDAAGVVLDRALVIWFPGPASYTGEDCAELHLHGGRAVLAAVLDQLIVLGARPAEPGEFSRRAFLNGRMDLVEAEGVADLIEAETEAQRRQALRQMDGALSGLLAGWADRLRRVLAFQEALIDFPDEDVPMAVETELLAELDALRAGITTQLDDGRRGERLRDGLTAAVIGAPNAGKSSLVNALAGRDAAIVSPFAGTTRDALEVRLALRGLPVTLVDTAGLRDTDDLVEAEGVRRARARAADAELVIAVLDATQPDPPPIPAGRPVLLVANKVDLAPAPPGALPVSARDGTGLDALRSAMAERLSAAAEAGLDGSPPLTRARHRTALAECLASLDAARAAALPELRGEDLRGALQALGRITGAVGVEDILDTVFGSFCIGK